MTGLFGSGSVSAVGPYEVEGVLGRGGMAVVYAARAPDGTQVAVKRMRTVLPDDAVERRRFEREARIRVEHPNVVQVLDAGVEASGVPYIVFERLDGETLKTVIERGPVSWKEAVRIGAAVARGVEAAHAAGFIHRDLKPANVLLCKDGAVKVIDFGIALLDRAAPRFTDPGAIVGTPAYMSPEQVRGSVALDERADVWSLGCLLHQCLTGTSPFHRASSVATMLAVLREEPNALGESTRGAPAALEELIRECLHKEVDRRLPAMSLAREQLDRMCATPHREPQPEENTTISVALPSLPPAEVARERRVVALAMAADVRDAASFDAAVKRSDGITYPLRDGTVVALWGADRSQGDELERATAALFDVRKAARTIALVLGEVRGRSGALVGEGLLAAEHLVLQAEPGLCVDGATARALEGKSTLRERAGGVFLVTATDADAQTPLVGRELELGRLRAALERTATEARAASVLIVGATGAGKTRLLRAAMVDAQSLGFVVHVARAESVSTGGAFGSFRRVFTRLLGDAPTPGAIEQLLRDGGVRASELPEITSTLHAWLAPSEAFSPDLPAIRLALWTFLEASARRGPTCLVVEDLHWVDPPSRTLITDLSTALDDAPLLVIAASRSTESVASTWTAVIQLEALTLRAVQALAQAHLGSAPSEAAARRLFEHTGGNALFVDQLLRETKARGASLDDERFPLPVSVEAVVQARLDRLTQPEREVCAWAALVGRAFEPSLLEAVGGPRGTLQHLDALRREGLVARRVARAGNEHRIQHALIGEAILATLSPEQKQSMHGRLADALTKTTAPDPEEVATHFELAGDLANATEWLTRAVWVDEGAGNLVATPRLLAKFDELGVPPPCVLLFRSGVAANEVGRTEEGLALLTRIRAAATTSMDRTFAELLAHNCALKSADAEAILRAARQAKVEATAAHAMRYAGSALQLECHALTAAGRIAEARAALDAFLEANPVEALARGPLSMVHYAYAILAVHQENPVEQVRNYELARDYSREAGNFGFALLCDSLALDARGRLGDFDSPGRLLACAEQISRLGRKSFARSMCCNAADVLARAGRFAEAHAAFARGERLGHYASPRADAAGEALYRGRFELASGDARAAITTLESCLDAIYAWMAVLARALRAEAHRTLGELDAALAESHEAMRGLEAFGALPEDEAEVFLYRARALRAAGRLEEAAAVATRGRERLLTRADKIADAAIRRSFLENLPTHRALLTE